MNYVSEITCQQVDPPPGRPSGAAGVIVWGIPGKRNNRPTAGGPGVRRGGAPRGIRGGGGVHRVRCVGV